jgi:hypothetical protein
VEVEVAVEVARTAELVFVVASGLAQTKLAPEGRGPTGPPPGLWLTQTQPAQAKQVVVAQKQLEPAPMGLPQVAPVVLALALALLATVRLVPSALRRHAERR